MEAIKRQLKATALFLSALLLFQSCVVYHKAPTTLEKASQERLKTKIWFADEVQEFPSRYEYILVENDQYFGMEEIEKGELVKVLLKENEILKVKTKNKNTSTWATIGVCTLGLGVIVAIIAANFDPY